MGTQGGGGDSQNASFYREGQRGRGRRNDSHEAQQDGSGCWLGLPSKEENTAHTVLVHYLSCN